jgi:hypothetical protein
MLTEEQWQVLEGVRDGQWRGPFRRGEMLHPDLPELVSLGMVEYQGFFGLDKEFYRITPAGRKALEEQT